MNIFMTSGTPDFMTHLKDKYANELMIVMHGEGNSLLLHETEGKTVFQTPRRYEVIGSSGTFEDNGYFVLNNIPVTDEGRPIFEQQFKKRANMLDEEPGFIAFRLLRPLDSNMYIVMTEWSAAQYYTMWTNSSSFAQAHLDDQSEAGIDNTPHLFTSAASITTYSATTKKDDA